MISKWYDKKDTAIKYRKNGTSIRDIEKRLGIPRSTLSGWLRDILLTKEQNEKLSSNWNNALVHARKKAVIWHNTQKEKRVRAAENLALLSLSNLNTTNISVIELALAMLYLGEGGKGEQTAMGNSDPVILKFFVSVLTNIYKIDIQKMSCTLNLRADQNPEEIKNFWAHALNLPLQNFKGISFDKRTLGSKTYSHYKGVCQIKCGNIAIQRKLMALSKTFCNKVIQQNLNQGG